MNTTEMLEKIEKMILDKFPEHQGNFIINTIEEIIDSKTAKVATQMPAQISDMILVKGINNMTTEQENIKNLTEQLRSIKNQLEIANREYIKKNCTIKPGERFQGINNGSQIYIVDNDISYNPFSGRFEFTGLEEEWPFCGDSMNFDDNEVIWLDRTAHNMV